MSFFGHWNKAGCFPEHWHSLKVEAQVKEVLENSTELAGTGLQHARADVVWSSSFSLIEPLQLSHHLAGCDVKSRLGDGGWCTVVATAGVCRQQCGQCKSPGEGGMRKSVVGASREVRSGGEGGGESWCLLQGLVWSCGGAGFVSRVGCSDEQQGGCWGSWSRTC